MQALVVITVDGRVGNFDLCLNGGVVAQTWPDERNSSSLHLPARLQNQDKPFRNWLLRKRLDFAERCRLAEDSAPRDSSLESSSSAVLTVFWNLKATRMNKVSLSLVSHDARAWYQSASFPTIDPAFFF